jgi:hypothetical protein
VVRFNLLVLSGGLLGYLVSIIASTALVLLFFRLNAKLLPGRKVTNLFAGESSERSVAPAIALGAATLSEAYLLRHAVFVVMTLVQDFLITYGSAVLEGNFPFGPFLKLSALSLLLFIVLSALAVLSIWIAGAFFNWMTRGIDELKEIAQGNIAVAILFAFVLFAVTAILNEGIEDVSRALIPYSRSGVVRIP